MGEINLEPQRQDAEFKQEGLKREVLSGVAWTTVASTSIRIFAGLSNLVLAKLLAPEVFGVIAIANVVIGAMELFSDFGVNKALIQQRKDLPTAANTALLLRLGQGFILFLLALSLAGKLAQYYHTPELRYIIPILGLNFLIYALGAVPMSLLSRDLKFKQQVLPQALPAFVQFTSAIVLASLGFGVWSIVAGMVLFNLLQTVLYWRSSPIKLNFQFKAEIARSLLKFGLPLFASGLVYYAVYNIDNVVVGSVLGMKQLGWYAFAFSLINLPTTEIVYVLNRVMYPAYAKISQDISELKRVNFKAIHYIMLVSLPLSLGIPLFGREFLVALYGDKWAGAIAPLQAFGGYAVVRSFSAIMGNVFLAVGRTGFMFLNALLNLILIGIFIYPMVTWGGIFGVAGLYSMVWVITLIVLIVWLDKLVGIKFKEIFTQLKFPLMGSLIAMLPVKYLLGAAISLSNLLTFIPAIILVVIIYLYVISRLDQEAGESIKRCWREKKLVLI